MRIRQMKFEF